MSRKYYQKMKKLLAEDYKSITKLYLIYELDVFTDASKINDSLLDRVYREYLNNKHYNSLYDYVLAIQKWCETEGVDFVDIEDYKELFNNI